MSQSDSLLQGIAEATCLGIMTTDAVLKITSWNNWLENSSGISASEVVGGNLLDAFPELVAHRCDRYYGQALSSQMVLLSQRLHGYLLPFPPSVHDTGLTHMQQS